MQQQKKLVNTDVSKELSIDGVFFSWLLLWFKTNRKSHIDYHVCTYGRVGKTRSLGPWSRVIVYCGKLSFCQNEKIILAKGELATIH